MFIVVVRPAAAGPGRAGAKIRLGMPVWRGICPTGRLTMLVLTARTRAWPRGSEDLLAMPVWTYAHWLTDHAGPEGPHAVFSRLGAAD
jgi:hypothetical protein